MEVEKLEGGIRVKRELEDGWFQHVEMPLPALLTIQSGINKLRYATLMGIKKAKTKEVQAPDARRTGRRSRRASITAGTRLSAGTRQADADLRGQPQGSRGQAGRETEVRGAGHMSILVVMEQRGGAWNRMSLETLAAAQQLAAELQHYRERGRPGAGHRSARRGTGRQAAREGLRGRARAAEGLHAGRLHRRAAATDRAGEADVRAVPAHLPGARFPAQAGDALGTVAVSDVVAHRVDDGR